MIYFRQMFGIIAQICSSFSFGVSNALWKIPMNQIGQFPTIFLRTVFSVLFLTLSLWVFGFELFHSEWFQLAFAVLLSALSFLGLYFFTKAMKNGAASVVSVATASAFIVGQLTAVVALGEIIKPFHYISLLLFLFAIVVLDKDSLKLKFSKELGYALVAAISWGTTLTLMAIPAREIGSLSCSWITEITVLMVSGVVLFLNKSSLKLSGVQTKISITLILMGLLSALGVSLMYIAFSLTEAYIVVALSAITHNIAVIASRVILKEPLNRNLLLSSVLSTIGIISILF